MSDMKEILGEVYMSNLGQAIEEEGIAIGEAMAEAKIIITMYNNGFTAEQIAYAINKNIERVEAIIKGKSTGHLLRK